MKLIYLLYTLLCSLFLMTAHASLYPPDLQNIFSHGIIRVGIIANDAPPFSDINMANNIAQKLGVKAQFNFEAETFDQLVKLLKENKIDIAMNSTPTLERGKAISFTKPYQQLDLALLVNRLVLSQNKFEDKPILPVNSPNYRIGVLQSSAYTNYARYIYPKATLAPYADIHQAMQYG